MVNRYYSSTGTATTLGSGISNSGTSIIVGSVTGFPVSYPYTLIIDAETVSEEVVTVTAGSGTNLTVTRGQDGTTGVSHSSGAEVIHGVSARDYREPQEHIATATGAWTDYTAPMRSNNSDASVGNGTIVARYRKVGRTVDFCWQLLSGSTTTWGTGGGGISGLLPHAPQGGTARNFVYTVQTGSSAIAAVATKSGSGNWHDLYNGVSSSTLVTGLQGAGHVVMVSGTYEAAA